MILSVWLMHKPGEPRTYTTTVCPTRAQIDSYKSNGFEVFEAKILLPIYPESEILGVNGIGTPVDSVDVEGTGQGR